MENVHQAGKIHYLHHVCAVSGSPGLFPYSGQCINHDITNVFPLMNLMFEFVFLSRESISFLQFYSSTTILKQNIERSER